MRREGYIKGFISPLLSSSGNISSSTSYKSPAQASSTSLHSQEPQANPNPPKMQYFKTLALTALLFGSAIAAPNNKPTKPAKPTPTPGPVQNNVCANGDAPYCCNTDGFGFYTTCTVLGKEIHTLEVY